MSLEEHPNSIIPSVHASVVTARSATRMNSWISEEYTIAISDSLEITNEQGFTRSHVSEVTESLQHLSVWRTRAHDSGIVVKLDNLSRHEGLEKITVTASLTLNDVERCELDGSRATDGLLFVTVELTGVGRGYGVDLQLLHVAVEGIEVGS